jgi:thiamine pyrophosphate-dependent acetolactate synthase large subunit-like protein
MCRTTNSSCEICRSVNPRALLRKTGLPIVGTFQAAGTVSADLFKSFAGRIGQLDNTPGDELLATADVIITVGYDPVEYDRPSGIIQDASKPPAASTSTFNQTLRLQQDFYSLKKEVTPC